MTGQNPGTDPFPLLHALFAEADVAVLILDRRPASAGATTPDGDTPGDATAGATTPGAGTSDAGLPGAGTPDTGTSGGGTPDAGTSGAADMRSAAEGPPVLFANAAMAALAGVHVSQIVGRRCLTLLDDVTDPEVRGRLATALRGRSQAALEVWTHRATGAPVPTRWELLPLVDPEETHLYQVLLVHDLTPLRLGEQELSDLRALMRDAAHDLNNMLAGLIVNVSLATGPTLSEEQRQTCLRDALQAARGGAETTRALLVAAREPGTGGSAARDDGRNGAGRAEEDSADMLDALSEISRPAAPPPARRRPREVRNKQPELAANAGWRGALLILDDDEKLLRMMTGFLEHAGYEVSATSEPSQCLARYREALDAGHRFDLVILDLTIDDERRGRDTLAELRKIDPTVRAVAHSGNAYADRMIAPTEHGYAGAIQKPTPLSDLAATIDALLRAAP